MVLDNQAPTFSTFTTQYIFESQEWRYQIIAKDPESFPLKYTLIGEDYGMRISPAGIITWIPSERKVYSFTVKAEDPCGLYANKKFEVEVKNCTCKKRNGAICKWNNPVQPEKGSSCVCPDGCIGERFEIYVDYFFTGQYILFYR